MKAFYLAMAILCSLQYAMAEKKFDLTVAPDGSGQFKTVQEAIDYAPEHSTKPYRIHIKPGVYKEKLTLPAEKTNICFYGDDAKTTVLTYDDFASKKNKNNENIGTTGSSSFFVNADGFRAENITFENSSGPVGQAVAVRIEGDRVAFINCRFLGFQDTLYPHGNKSRQYYKNCYIEGTVDFIFGFSVCYFDHCSIFCKARGYVTAASTPQGNNYGFVFNQCSISSDSPAGSFCLGRPWRPYAQVVFLQCSMSDVISPEGWDNWGKTENEATAFYAEYRSTGKGADATKRVRWSKQLTDEQAGKYNRSLVLGNWNPDK